MTERLTGWLTPFIPAPEIDPVRDVFIVGAARTPIGKFQGSLAGFRAPELGAIAIKEAVTRSKVTLDQVDEVIMGNVLAAGLGQNPARQAARKAGVPDARGALTINKVCGSGLKACVLAAQAIKCGDAEIVVAGGQESMTNAPYLLPEARAGVRLGHGKLLDSMVHDGLWDIYNDFHMGATAELVSKKYGVTRGDQDEFSLSSQRKALAAIQGGKFKAEIVPVEIPQRKGAALRFDTDEGPRADTTLESLSQLRPVFQKDGGTVTAGNASTINDGGAALVLASADAVKRLSLQPLARVVSYATGGCAPEWVMMAPLDAVKNVTAKMNCTARDFDLYEFNEAFAVQSVALVRELKLDPEKVNVHGGAVALGHPIGCSGARILVTLIHALRDRGLKKGLASLCLGGGNAVAMAIER